MAALAIDTKHCIPQLQNYLDVVAGQTTTTTGQVRKIYAHATILHDAARIAAVQGALDHQADELEVFHYVNNNQQRAETSSLLLELASQIPSTSAMSRPKRAAPGDLNIGFICDAWRGTPVKASDPSLRPEKRRRTAVGLEGDDRSEEKQFKGVRYRPDRKKWVAEMKPPKHGNKVSFGEFKSQEQAARVVDAAFYYYQKPHFLNFPESTSEVLASKPMPAGFDEKEKLVFVKEQAKWLASMDHSSTLSPAAPVPPGSRSCSEFSSDRCQGMLVIYHTYMSPPPAPTIPRQFCEEPAQELLHQPWNEPEGYAATLN